MGWACFPPKDGNANANVKPARSPQPTVSPLKGKAVDWKATGLRFNVPEGWQQQSLMDNAIVYGDTASPPGKIALTMSLSRPEDEVEAEDTLAKTKDSFSPGLADGRVEDLSDKNVADFVGFRVVKSWPDRDGWQRLMYFGIRRSKGNAQILNFTCGSVAADFETARGVCAGILESVSVKL